MSGDELMAIGRRKADRTAAGILALLVIQFGWHETRLRELEGQAQHAATAIAAVTSATDERKGALEGTIARLELGAAEQAKAVTELRLIVVELRAAMSERRRR